MLGFQYSSVKRCVAQVAIFGILIQAFLTVFHTTSQASGKDGGFTLFTRFVVICTGDGVKRVPAVDSQDFGDSSSPAHHVDAPECWLCGALTGNNLASSAGHQDLLSPLAFLKLLSKQHVSANQPVLARRSRGPPAVFA